MVSAGNEPVNLRRMVKSLISEEWPSDLDDNLKPYVVGHVNMKSINRTSGLNHYVKLTKVTDF